MKILLDTSLYTVPEIWHVTDVICIFHFRLFFPFYPTNYPKNQNLKKMKKKMPGDIIILHMCTKHYDHMRPCQADFLFSIKYKKPRCVTCFFHLNFLNA